MKSKANKKQTPRHKKNKLSKALKIGAIIGLLFGILAYFLGLDSIFHIPIDYILSMLCSSSSFQSTCNNIFHFAILNIITTLVFYVLLFSFIGVVIHLIRK